MVSDLLESLDDVLDVDDYNRIIKKVRNVALDVTEGKIIPRRKKLEAIRFVKWIILWIWDVISTFNTCHINLWYIIK